MPVSGSVGFKDIGYVFNSYLPFLLVTVILPVTGLVYLWTRSMRLSRKGLIMARPPNTVYVVYLIASLISAMGAAVAFYKAAVDYVYGSMSMWRFIKSDDELTLYMSIGRMIAFFHFLAGLGIGLMAQLPYARRSYDYWYVDLGVYLANIGWFLYLSRSPLDIFHYAYAYRLAKNIPVSASPYDLIKWTILKAFALGVLLGLMLTSLIVITRRRKGG